MKKSVLFLTLVSVIPIVHAIDYKPLDGVLEEYNSSDKAPRSHITFVQDPQGDKYVVKQYRYERWPSILATSLCELVALDMGHALGVSLNQACLIPAGVSFIGKEKMVPASLHTLVPGMPFNVYLELNTGLYADLDLKQKDEREQPLGLSRELVYHMSRHKDFPLMVALDTYVSNMGRLRHNFFYDETTDKFYGIDMASSFYKDLCGPSIENLNSMLASEHTHFTKAEGKALATYYRALKKLVKWYPAEFICNQLDKYAKRAGYYEASFFDAQVQANCLALLEKRKVTIKKTCKNASELVKVLQQLLKKHGLG